MSTKALDQYLQHNSTPLRQSTLAFLIKGDSILLAMKKRGFGVGKWNGVGGKPNPNETIEETARREMVEEIGVQATTIRKAAIFSFYFPHQPQDDQEVHTFLVDTWEGEPIETEEMRPQWFPFSHIPYESMWPDDRIWMPEILKGHLVLASFLFSKDNKILEHIIHTTSTL